MPAVSNLDGCYSTSPVQGAGGLGGYCEPVVPRAQTPPRYYHQLCVLHLSGPLCHHRETWVTWGNDTSQREAHATFCAVGDEGLRL